jgi:catechol 2,3-dioxygenase
MSVRAFGHRPPGFRLPDGTRVGRVRLQISDLPRSLAYYQDVMGFRLLTRGGGQAMLGVTDGAPLLELRERPGATRPRGRLGLYHFAVLLPDRGALGRFVRHVQSLGLHPGAADHLVSEALYLTDPDGLGIEVYADRPRAEWSARGEELVMASDPLDWEGLTAAAGEHAWTGVPDGTVVGHVHLHVGDLAAAARFYHAALGLDITASTYPGALFLSAGGYHHHLGVNIWAGPGATPPRDDEARLLDWELVLPASGDLAPAATSLEQAGYSVSPGMEGWEAADPWQTTLRLVARP